MVKIEIDGKELEVQPGTTIIQAADAADIYIPRFCYHKKLSVAANCRMCLVEVEKMGKPQPACATPVGEGMKILTKSTKALQAQKAVMEFLLINHPLDCPICDQGGQCELQDLAMGFGADVSRYDEGKRAVTDPDLGPFISTDMTRCIHCTRCVRFGEEIAGVRELGAVNRGEHMSITTYVKHTVKSELSGNVIDICPVGALTSKPFRFQARAWELKQLPSVAVHDCIGSNIHLCYLRGQLLRVNPKENEAINEVWISDRDRFSYAGIHSAERALKPMIKQNGQWQEVDWAQAFDFVVNYLRNVTAKQADQVGFIASPSATCEELYLFQKLARGLNVKNIDHRLRQTDFSQQENQAAYPTLGVSIAEIEHRDAILLIGSNIQKDQPIAGLKVRKATLHGAKIAVINPVDHDFNFHVQNKLIVAPSEMLDMLAAVVKAAAEIKGKKNAVVDLCNSVTVHDGAREMAEMLCGSQKASIILGNFAHMHPQATLLQILAQALAEIIGATFGGLTWGANTQGAHIAGVLPHRTAEGVASEVGLNLQQMWQQQLKAYVLLGVEPELDSANSGKALRALQNAECVISLSSFVTDAMKNYADVILPIATLGETSGTLVNVEGKWQTFTGVVAPQGEARPAWKVLRVLGNLFELDGFDYVASEEVLAELKTISADKHAATATFVLPAALPAAKISGQDLQRISDVSLYTIDPLTRQSKPLQEMIAGDNLSAVRLNKKTAQRCNAIEGRDLIFRQAGQQMTMKVLLDERVPDNCVLLHEAIKETAGFAETFGLIEV